jgi:LemA protein
MKRSTVILLVILGIIVLFIFGIFRWGTNTYNSMVTNREAVTSQWGNVQTQYQRRMDLIPNFVRTVQGAANFEKSTLTDVINARAKATQVTVDPRNITPDAMAQFQKAQAGVSSALGRLMVVVEKYPELKATQNFRDLQTELEGTENRIATERKKFNDIAQVYNTLIQRFPGSIISGMFHFTEKPYFTAAEGADKAPEVKF